jgi:hypothetical protein
VNIHFSLFLAHPQHPCQGLKREFHPEINVPDEDCRHFPVCEQSLENFKMN